MFDKVVEPEDPSELESQQCIFAATLPSDDQDDQDQDSLQISMRHECAIGHRVQATRSVLALALDEEFVFAGLQGGDILVGSMLNWRRIRRY